MEEGWGHSKRDGRFGRLLFVCRLFGGLARAREADAQQRSRVRQGGRSCTPHLNAGAHSAARRDGKEPGVRGQAPPRARPPHFSCRPRPVTVTDWRALRPPHVALHTPCSTPPLHHRRPSAPPPQLGGTPLFISASHGRLGLVDSLLVMGAQINSKLTMVPELPLPHRGTRACGAAHRLSLPVTINASPHQHRRTHAHAAARTPSLLPHPACFRLPIAFVAGVYFAARCSAEESHGCGQAPGGEGRGH